MSYSYQDLDARLGIIERKIDFLFKLMTFNKRTPTSLLDEQGRQGFKVETLTMDELYREVSNAGGLKSVEEIDDSGNEA